MKAIPEIINGIDEDGVCIEVERKTDADLLLLYVGSNLIAGAIYPKSAEEPPIKFEKTSLSTAEQAVLDSWKERYALTGVVKIAERLVKNLEDELDEPNNIMNIVNQVRRG